MLTLVPLTGALATLKKDGRYAAKERGDDLILCETARRSGLRFLFMLWRLLRRSGAVFSWLCASNFGETSTFVTEASLWMKPSMRFYYAPLLAQCAGRTKFRCWLHFSTVSVTPEHCCRRISMPQCHKDYYGSVMRITCITYYIGMTWTTAMSTNGDAAGKYKQWIEKLVYHSFKFMLNVTMRNGNHLAEQI